MMEKYNILDNVLFFMDCTWNHKGSKFPDNSFVLNNESSNQLNNLY